MACLPLLGCVNTAAHYPSTHFRNPNSRTELFNTFRVPEVKIKQLLVATMVRVPIKRVAVIGAGPAGAIAIDALAQEKAFDMIRVFERREGAGGCW